MKKLLALLLIVTSVSFAALAQEKDETKKQPEVYKIDFTVSEVQGGKHSNARNYTMFVRFDNRPHTTKVGNRIPISTTGKEGQPSVQYMDVGLQINCSINADRDGGVVIDFNFELASLVTPEGAANNTGVPVIRQIRQDGMAFLPLGKPTVIVSADDTNTNRTIQLEATATKVK